MDPATPVTPAASAPTAASAPADPSAYDQIRFQVVDGVATLALHNPARRNALEPQMRAELADALARVRAEPAIRALVLCGSGEHFCSGGDLRNIASANLDNEGWRQRMRAAHHWLQDLLALERPVIAAIDGVAYGAGFSLALGADFILATPRARFCMSFLRVGLVPDFGALYTLPRVVGVQRARELMLSAREVSGTEALQLGIAMELHAPDKLMARAQALAASMVHASPAAVGMIKRALATPDPGLAGMMELEANAQALATGTAAHKEAVRRFLAKEPALFQWPPNE